MSYVAGGCSTYSHVEFTHLPHYPKFLHGGYDCWVYDDEQDYIDFTCSLGAVSVGYAFREKAVSTPLLPLPHKSEERAAKKLCEITGWEQVRWCKNGSDATEAAVRLARFLAQKPVVLTNSYHGSHSDLVTATPKKGGGVLGATEAQVVACATPEELLWRIQTYASVGAVIVEPITWDRIDWKLAELKEACGKAGVVLIFDEMITGWRGRPGSIAPEVKPDLACYGKAIANGEALACVAGPRVYMRLFEERVFMSGTYAAGVTALEQCFFTLDQLDTAHFERMTSHQDMLWKILGDIVVGYPGRLHITLPKDKHEAFVDALAEKGILVGRDFFFMKKHGEQEIGYAYQLIEEVRTDLGL